MTLKSTHLASLSVIPHAREDIQVLRRRHAECRRAVEDALHALDQATTELVAALSEVDAAPARPVLSLKQAAEVLGVSRSTLQRMLANKKIPTVTVGNTPKIRRDDLDRYLAVGA